MRIVTTEEMLEIERQSFDAFKLGEDQIIENVGIRASDLLLREVVSAEKVHFVVICGKGNNGADGLAIARHLACADQSVTAFILGPGKASSALQRQSEIAEKFGVRIVELHEIKTLEEYLSQLNSFVAIDALFGMGIRLPLSNFHYEIIHCLNELSPYTVSVDLPSGVDGTTGKMMGNAVNAKLTLAVGLPKTGHYLAEGARHSGVVHVLSVGFPPECLQGGRLSLLQLEEVLASANRRNKFADKKVYGHTLVVGGSHGLTGALCLSTQAALKVGAGLVTGATWEAQYQEFVARLSPEIMTGFIPMDEHKWDRVLGGLEKYSSIVVGPGLGRSARARRAVLSIMQSYAGPIVLDADALNVLKIEQDSALFKARKGPTVMTPHMGEFARFMGQQYDEVSSDPLRFLRQATEFIPCSIILKGPCTFLALPSGQVQFSFYPNDGMASGGSGDVLAGILGGLLSQSSELKRQEDLFHLYNQFDKILGLAILIHTQSGKIAAEEFGVRAMSAGSLIDVLPQTFLQVDKLLKN